MAISTQRLIRAAAHNNAVWCAVMSRAHGVAGEFGAQAWIAAARPPIHYPDAVTLAPGADPSALAVRIDTDAPGASVKDSFADLDLTDAGFRVLFESHWIHRPAGTPPARSPLSWEVVTDAERLRGWALAWDDGDGHADLFRPQLLDDPATVILGAHDGGGGVVAGAVATCSDQLVGVSNVFVRAIEPDDAWPVILGAVDSLFPHTPVVGYEHGDALSAASLHGFEILDPLRVWIQADQRRLGVGQQYAVVPPPAY